MGTTTLSGTNSPYPETAGAMKAAVTAINNAGGIKGHPLQLTICDDQGNPNIAQSCAEQAVSGHDVAVVGPIDVQTASVIPVLQAAGIPFTGQITQVPLDVTSPVSFPLAAGGTALDLAAGKIARQIGCKKVGAVIIQLSNITPSIQNAITTGLTLNHVDFVGATYAPTSSTDFTSALSTLQQKGADCVATAIDEQQTTAFLSALKQSGTKMTPIIPGLTLAPLSQIGPIATGAYVYSGGRLPTDPTAGVQQADQQIKALSPGTAITATALEGWAGVQLVADALRNVTGAYTAASVLTAMGHLQDASTGDLYAPYTTTKPDPVQGWSHFYNPTFATYQVQGTSTKTLGTWQVLPGY